MRFIAAVLLALGWMLGAQSQPAQAQKRIALLIGNQDYNANVGRLKNPHNDIELMAGALKQVGFEVLPLVKDARRSSMLGAVRRLVAQLNVAGPDAVGFLYYAGHGAAERDTDINYLIPVDATSPDTAEFWDESLKLDDILKLLENAKNAAHFVVFDACRNELNLAERSTTRGFIPVAAQAGMFIAYATAPGRPASDKGERSGPYAAALAAELARLKPGVSHLDLFQNVKEAVEGASGGRQVPWERNGLSRRVFFVDEAAVKLPSTPPPAITGRAPEVECDRLAAHPEDPDAVVSGVAVERIDVQRAIRACDLAKSQFPAEKRFVYQLARAHTAAKDYARQKALLEELVVGEGYTAAYFSLGLMHQAGQAVAQDRAAAVKLFRQGGEKGHVRAMIALGEELLRGTSPEERTEGVNWLRKVAEKGNLRVMLALGRWLLGRTDPNERSEGLALIERAAEAGDGEAMYAFASLHWNGEGVPQDMTKAVFWMEKAAVAGGSTAAMEYLGQALLKGKGIARDEWKAADWLRKAANAGRPSAMLALGNLYWSGTGVPKDLAEAFRRYREAAEIAIRTGDSYPLCVLADTYLGGKAVSRDPAEAAKWFTKAAEGGGCTISMVNLGLMHIEGSGGLQKDDAKAEAWFRKATQIDPAALGCPFADAYLRGKVLANQAQTVVWFTKAAEAGCPFSKYSIGVIHAEGRGVPKDDAKAEALFREARVGLQEELLDDDKDTATAMLSDMHRHGRGGPKNDEEAFRLALESAQLDHPVGMTWVGELYELGRGVSKSEREAATWYRKGSEVGVEAASLHLGRLHAEGRGVAKSEAEARELFRKAARSEFVEYVWRNAAAMIDSPEFGLLRRPDQTATLLLLTLAEAPKYRERLVADAGKIPAPVRIAVQKRLKQAGHYRGPLNGTFGPPTKAALEAWAAGR